MQEIEKKIKELSKYCHEIDDFGTAGVLLSDEIEHYATKHKMIVPFHKKRLKPAGYHLSMGEEYALGGKLKKLYSKSGKDELIIPPFQVAIISTKEIINLPRFIIARWNLRVKRVYDGLLWTGALQVDPGWVGPLFCPIYNLSNEEVKIKLGEPIILMDFVKTTPFKKGVSNEYPRPPEKRKLKNYDWRLESALFSRMEAIEQVKNKVNRVETIIGIVIVCIAILFTALSIFVTSAQKEFEKPPPIWLYISVGLSVAAFTMALSSLVRRRLRNLWVELLVTIAISIILVLIILGGIKIILW